MTMAIVAGDAKIGETADGDGHSRLGPDAAGRSADDQPRLDALRKAGLAMAALLRAAVFSGCWPGLKAGPPALFDACLAARTRFRASAGVSGLSVMALD